ncbi:MAG: SGNH/GDSL hydrolase family protein [Ruminococcus sp.]|nr:SGNH/GDSL hydrolase family protein [Ruminococcus sp.]
MIIRKLLPICAAAVMSLPSIKMTEIPKKEVVHNIEVPPKMVFLGDSIAAGYGLEGYTSDDNYNCRSYSNILKEKYTDELKDECGHEMINKAVSGATSQDLIDLLKSGKLDCDLKDSDAVVVSIGGNDLLGIMLGLLDKLGVGESGSFDSGGLNILAAASAFLSMDSDVNAALDGFDANIKVISDELSKRTDGTVYIQTLYDPLEYFTNFSMVTDFSSEKIGRFNDIIKSNAADSYTVIDVAADFKGKAGSLTNISNFDIHPNQEGHELIAQEVDSAFRETGFTYTTIEYGEKRLTAEGRKVIAGGIAGMGLLFVSGTVLLVRKKK